LGNITTQACPENFGQIQKIIFQRAGFTFDGTAGKDITLLADWQALKTASDDTKAQITPFVYSPVITAGDSITNGGGDNSTLNGVSELVGVNASNFSALFKGLNSASISELVAYACENNLVAYFCNKAQDIICAETVLGSAVYTGISIQELFVGDKTNNGLATKDENAITFAIPDGWSKTVKVIKPVFNPLSAL
jgi:hypothetical protein